MDVLLLDKETWPRDKVCGDGWLQSLKPILTDMGVWDEMKAENTVSGGNDFILASPNGDCVEYKMSAEEGGEGALIIPRRIGDDIVRRGRVCGVRGYYRNEPMEIEADAVIVANGSHSMLGRWESLTRTPPFPCSRPAATLRICRLPSSRDRYLILSAGDNSRLR